MKIETVNEISNFQFDDGTFPGIKHGFFTRKGGVSPFPWDSLNLGGTVGDSRENVIENRKRIFDSIGRSVDSIYDVWQVHSTDTICTNNPRSLFEPHQKADAIFTDNPEVTLLMRFADCVPIILHDPVQHVVGIVHAGWQGTVRMIVQHAIESIQMRYHVNIGNLVAGIGPSIGPDHYFVGDSVYQEARNSFGKPADSFFSNVNGAKAFDLWQANRYILENAGVTSIHSSNICTACNLQDWYSHRAEHGKTGRFACVAYLEE